MSAIDEDFTLDVETVRDFDDERTVARHGHAEVVAASSARGSFVDIYVDGMHQACITVSEARSLAACLQAVLR